MVSSWTSRSSSIFNCSAVQIASSCISWANFRVPLSRYPRCRIFLRAGFWESKSGFTKMNMSYLFLFSIFPKKSRVCQRLVFWRKSKQKLFDFRRNSPIILSSLFSHFSMRLILRQTPRSSGRYQESMDKHIKFWVLLVVILNSLRKRLRYLEISETELLRNLSWDTMNSQICSTWELKEVERCKSLMITFFLFDCVVVRTVIPLLYLSSCKFFLERRIVNPLQRKFSKAPGPLLIVTKLGSVLLKISNRVWRIQNRGTRVLIQQFWLMIFRKLVLAGIPAFQYMLLEASDRKTEKRHLKPRSDRS